MLNVEKVKKYQFCLIKFEIKERYIFVFYKSESLATWVFHCRFDSWQSLQSSDFALDDKELSVLKSFKKLVINFTR